MRLLSYNIHKGIGGLDRRYDLDRIAQVIEHENPDLLCLQEVTRHARMSKGDDQPNLLRRFFAIPNYTFQMNVHYRVGGYGNLILSRWPIVSRHHISLRLGKRKPRGGQVVVIDSPEGQICIAHWHLGLFAHERRWQTEHLLNHPLFRQSESLPTIVVGDSNDWNNRLATGAFKENGFVQVTSPPSRFKSFPAIMPSLSVDKAFQRGLFIRETKMVRTKLAHLASDHLPLLVDFHLHALGSKSVLS